VSAQKTKMPRSKNIGAVLSVCCLTIREARDRQKANQWCDKTIDQAKGRQTNLILTTKEKQKPPPAKLTGSSTTQKKAPKRSTTQKKPEPKQKQTPSKPTPEKKKEKLETEEQVLAALKAKKVITIAFKHD
jgi:hypothetical protein